MKHIIKQEKRASIKSKLLETTFVSLVTVYSYRQKEYYTTTNRITLLNNVWKCLLKSDSFREYSDYLLQTTPDCTLVLHWHKLTVFTPSLLSAQSLMYITVSLSHFSLKSIILLDYWILETYFRTFRKPKTLRLW